MNDNQSYQKRTDAIGLGFALIILPFGAVFLYNLIEDHRIWTSIVLVYIALRMYALYTVCKIANEQNRSPDLWLVFSFLAPSIALIIIGMMNKKSEKSSYLKALEDLKED